MVSADRVRFFLRRFHERLWVRPLLVCLLSVAMVFAAELADDTSLARLVPEIQEESVEKLLSVMASTMMVIATFSVGAMVAAYASASRTATPRSFILVVTDDSSQNALSTFVGAFIFSIVSLMAVQNNYYATAGLFVLFVLTAIVFGVVIVTFVRWVDRIARLGRMGPTIDKVEKATAGALEQRRGAPTLRCLPQQSPPSGKAVFATSVGYVQHVDVAALQAWAEEHQARVAVAALPGTFAAPDRALAYVSAFPGDAAIDCTSVAGSFQIGRDRRFDNDPRFGLVVLSEIAGRALSPAVNDPGTAIEVVGVLVRLFALWGEPAADGREDPPMYDRVEVPELSVRDMFDDAFTPIARDGAGVVEVGVRLQKALHALASVGNAEMREAAVYHGRLALKRAEVALDMTEDLMAVRNAAGGERG